MSNQVCGRHAGRRPGFSIPELLAVLVITSILATLAIVASRLPRARADLARLNAEAHNLQLAQEAYRADHGRPYNGPFTPDATRAAEFSYTAPPDVTITVESTDPAAWTATLTGAETGAGTGAGAGTTRPSCQLSLSGATAIACTLSSALREQTPADNPSGAPVDLDHLRTNGQ